MVVVVGIDVHKDTHCAVAVDQADRRLGSHLTVRATDAGHRQLPRWAAREHGPAVEFTVEDCRHASTRLEQALLDTEATPIPASSSRTNRHRLARGGNRQLNAALHRIAITQIRPKSLGKTYHQRRPAQGDTTMEALRAPEQRLARIMFNLPNDTPTTAPATLPQAA